MFQMWKIRSLGHRLSTSWPGSGGHSYQSYYNHNSVTGPSHNKRAGGIQSSQPAIKYWGRLSEGTRNCRKIWSGKRSTFKREGFKFWKSIGAPYYILSITENGYKLPFASLPEPVKLRNNKSARLHATFVDQAIHELVLSGRICVDAQRTPGC